MNDRNPEQQPAGDPLKSWAGQLELITLFDLETPTPEQLRRMAELTEIYVGDKEAWTLWTAAAQAGDQDAIDMLEVIDEPLVTEEEIQQVRNHVAEYLFDKAMLKLCGVEDTSVMGHPAVHTTPVEGCKACDPNYESPPWLDKMLKNARLIPNAYVISEETLEELRQQIPGDVNQYLTDSEAIRNMEPEDFE